MKLTSKNIEYAATSFNSIASHLRNCGKIIAYVAVALAFLEIFSGFIAGLVMICDDMVGEGFIAIIGSIFSAAISVGGAFFLRLILDAFAENIEINYRTQKLTELWLYAHKEEESIAELKEHGCPIRQDIPLPTANDKEKADEALSAHFSRASSGESGYIVCPHCKRKQTAEHVNCMICGKPLRENK